MELDTRGRPARQISEGLQSSEDCNPSLIWRAGLPRVSSSIGLRLFQYDRGKSYTRKCSTNLLNVGDLYDHTHIADNVSEFLDYFVPRKVMAGNAFILKTCPRVIRKFLRWMREKKLVDFTNDEIQGMCENQLWEDTVRDLGLQDAWVAL